MGLGCMGCRERDLCGGIHTPHIYSCLSFCKCDDPSKCQYVCRNNLESYIEAVQEISGFKLETIARTPPLKYPNLPHVVPLFYHSYSRDEVFTSDAVAVPLSHLFNYQTGEVRFSSKEELAHAYGFSTNTQLVITGVDKDPPIEKLWSFALDKAAESLARLRPSLVTVPNYSLFLNVPRWHDLHSIKRIALVWNEFVSAGIPTSLHPNGRTDQDWQRWTDFVGERDEIQSLTYEFKTGPAKRRRGRWHTDKLLQLAATVERPLQLIVRGGYKYLNELYKAFHQVVFIDTTSFMKTVNRQRFEWHPGRAGKWQSGFTLIGQPIDELLRHNADTFANMISHRVRAESN